jgi:eukaryotic-like serine/threonine-protein kinase
MASLNVGQRLGAYEIIAPLGAGGMGEVFRARDTRLDRQVAIKVLPASIAESPDALARFEREARAVAALSHPNILVIHDFGQSPEATYAVMELLEGETLRARLSSGALPLRKAVDVGTQIARGLAAAHDRHIVHRDLKPENVFLTTDGTVKILDFGLARTTAPAAFTGLDSPTVAPATHPGTVLGTVGYMAPEQVRGEAADHRADLFALGCVLYEMITGRRAYRRETAAETLTAILREDPPDIASTNINMPPALVRTIRRCLEKRPEERFQSARDLAFALETGLDGSAARSGAAVPLILRRSVWRRSSSLVLAAAIALGAGAAWIAAKWAGADPQAARTAAAPSFRRLTYERGTIREARFGPDGRTVVYGATWESDPIRTFMTRTDSTEAVRVNVPDAQVLSVSRSGEMAISLGHAFEGWMGAGTLARASLLGGSPRPVLEHVREAEWAPDGSELAIVRRESGFERLEFPVNRVLYQTSGYISNIRFSPAGDRIAFADHPFFADDAGGVSIVDRQGTRTVLSERYNSVRGVAWSPDGREVWYSAATRESGANTALLAAPLSGSPRVLYTAPTQLRLFDIAADGRVLLGVDVSERRVEAMLAGDTQARDVTLRDMSTGFWVAPDGSAMTLADQAVPGYDAYLLRAGASAPVRLGRGQAFGMSSDGRWVAAMPATEPRVLLHSPGATQSKELPNPEQIFIDSLGWLPDGTGLVLFGQPAGRMARGYVQRLSGGPPRPFTPEGVGAVKWWSIAVSPDGAQVLGRDNSGRIARYPLDGSTPEPLAGLQPDELPTAWTTDGRALLVAHGQGRPWVIDRMDLASGRREKLLEIRPREMAGLRLTLLALSADGRYYVHSYSRLLSSLYVVEGLR